MTGGGIFRAFEAGVVRRLAAGRLAPELVESVLASADQVSCEHSGAGYFRAVSHPGLPHQRLVPDRPALVGTVDGVSCGFVVFMEAGALTLECHGWGAEDLPGDIRDRTVEISVAD